MMQTFNHRNLARGFSLLELMVALAISVLLLMGVVALFISSRASYETTERLSRIQENGRFALDQLTNDIRAAGYQGCARPPGTSRAVDYGITTLNNPTALLWNFAVPAQGFQGVGGSTFAPVLDTVTTTFSPAPSGAGDVLVLRMPRRDVVASHLRSNQGSPTGPLTIANVTPAPFRAGDTVVITDCEARAWFEVSSYAGGVIQHVEDDDGTTTTNANGDTLGVSPGNDSGDLLHPFKSGAEIVPVDTVIYYLARSTADPSRLSLWRKTGGSQNSDEIAEGVERLEVQYGVGTGGRVTEYRDASGITNWGNVYTVQIALLARAPDAYGTDLDTQEHVLFSTPTRVAAGPFNDRFQRKVFTATVAVRNQIID